MESILTSIKKLLGIAEDYTQFDSDIVMHINSVLMDLNGLGVGPSSGFFIEDDTATWTDFVSDPKDLQAIKSYMYLRVKLLFDSATLSSAVISSMEKQIEKFEWLINVAAENDRSGIIDENVSEEIQALIAQLESENEELKNLNAGLTSTNTALQKNIETLEEVNIALESDNVDLRLTNESLMERNSELAANNEVLQGENADLEASIEELQASIKPEQDKSVTITENGNVDVFPDDGKTLSKVNVTVDVETGNSEAEAKLAKIEGSIDQSKVLDGTGAGGTVEEKVDQLIDKAEDEKLWYELSKISLYLGQNLFREYKGTVLPRLNLEKTENMNYFLTSAANIVKIDDYINSASCKTMLTAFGSTTNLKYMKGINTSSCWNINSLYQNSGIEEIEIPFNFSNVSSCVNSFACHYLKEIRFDDKTINVSISFSSPVLSNDSIISIINGLADLTGQTQQTISFNSEVLDKLVGDNDLYDYWDIAESKNWIIE